MRKITLLLIILLSTTLTFAQMNSNDAETVPFATVQSIPLTSDCNHNKSQEKLRKCVQNSLSEFVKENFDEKMISTLGLKAGIYKIKTLFTISKDGEIMNVRVKSEFKEIKKEAIRVIKLIPKMKPGINNGEPVNVKYNLPIAFRV